MICDWSWASSPVEVTKLSRSKIDLFLECPRCFWLDVKKRIKRPPFPPYTINSSIDALLKKEFDQCREAGVAHYVMKQYNIDAVPYQCEHIGTWRNNFTGIQHKHIQTDFLVFGALDDVWINPQKELMVVDMAFFRSHAGYPHRGRDRD